MPLIYVAGRFRGPTAWDIEENVRFAERFGLFVAKLGAMPVIPHANTRYFQGQMDDQFWIDGTLQLLNACHGAIFIPDWRNSVGARGEWDATPKERRFDLGQLVTDRQGTIVEANLKTDKEIARLRKFIGAFREACRAAATDRAGRIAD